MTNKETLTFVKCIAICFLIRLCISDTIVCGQPNVCDLTTKSCVNNETCNIICNATESCYFSDLYCKDGYKCNIYCVGTEACQSTQIHCPSNGECSINCIKTRSCYSSVINGPYNDTFRIDCVGSSACESAIIDGTLSAKLFVTGCKCLNLNSLYSCKYLQIRAPPNSNGQKNCYLEGNNHLRNIKIYAINGWNDVDFRGYTGSGGSGTLFCTSEYSKSCVITSNVILWTCSNQSSICMSINNQQLQMPTTAIPTIDPTTIPSTNPSAMPTISTILPSAVPSIDPTSMLIINPSAVPSINSSSMKPSNLVAISTVNPIAMPTIATIMSPIINSYAPTSLTTFEGFMIGIGIFVSCLVLIILVCLAKQNVKMKKQLYVINHNNNMNNMNNINQFNSNGAKNDNDINNNNTDNRIDKNMALKKPKSTNDDNIHNKNVKNINPSPPRNDFDDEKKEQSRPILEENISKRHQEIKTWFDKHVGLNESNDKYYNIFLLYGYDDMSLIAELTNSKLIVMGINKMAHRDRIISVIEKTLSPVI